MARRTSTALFASSLALFSACDDLDAASAEAEPRAADAFGSGCSRWRCGYNAAEIHGDSLRELHLGGLPNADGARIVGYVAPSKLLGYQLRLVGDDLVAQGGVLGELRGAGLIGSTILVKLGSGAVVPVTVAGVESVASWAEGAAPITAYTLVYPDASDLAGKRNVCTGTLAEPLTAAVTLIGGETYDEATKTVEADRAGWVTFACAGSAAAKMKLMNYGPNSSFAGTGAPATPRQRQATLKMITADYCGDGEGHTATGTPIYWADAAGTVAPDSGAALGEFEAAWGPDGALCLDAPRRPDLAAGLGCALPACTAAHEQAGAWVTINPAQP